MSRYAFAVDYYIFLAYHFVKYYWLQIGGIGIYTAAVFFAGKYFG